MMSSINQESPAQNMTDEGHTMSSDMSGPVSGLNYVPFVFNISIICGIK